MPSAQSELQAGVHAVLTGDPDLSALLGGPNIYDQTPPRIGFPFITYGAVASLDWSTSSERGEELVFSIEIWSSGKGKAEAATIAGRVRVLIDALSLQPGDFRLVMFDFISSQTSYQDEAAAYRCILRYRALMERV